MTDPKACLPAFPASLQWLERPPLLAATGLRGHVVALLFFRLGCVHSREALADVASVQAAFAGRPFAALGVHVPTLAAERDAKRLRRTVAQVGEPVTVVVDAERALAAQCAVTALPWLVLADGDGIVRFAAAGEPVRARLAEAIEALLQDAAGRGIAARVPFAVVAPRAPDRLMPSGLAVDADLVYCAAAGHRRVYELTRAGAVQRWFGDGRAGGLDGDAAAAQLHSPGCLLLRHRNLLVADPGSHTLRAIDLDSGTVSTWCGTGSRSPDRAGGGFGARQGLAAPAALAAHEGGIHLALAGAHQVWQFDPDTQCAVAWLGTGARSLRDGGEAAGFVEPSGLAATADAMFVADAGGGALRRIDLAHAFATTVAQGLARPEAMVLRGGDLLVAARWQPAVLRVAVAGGPAEVLFDAADGLVEPSALALCGDELWIADAAADCLFRVDLAAAERRLVRVDVTGTPPPPPLPTTLALLAEPLLLRESADVTLRIGLPCPPGFQLDGGAPFEVDLVDEADPVLACDRHAAAVLDDGAVAVLAPMAGPGTGVLRVQVRGTVRAADARPIALAWRYVLPVQATGDGALAGDVRAAVSSARS